MKNIRVKRIEKGWAGHFICSDSCLFRRNTLLVYRDIKIVVSTVGNMVLRDRAGNYKPETIGAFGRRYETMAFYADYSDKRYFDADVSRPVSFDSEWCITELDADDKANDMHEGVVSELMNKLNTAIGRRELSNTPTT